MDYPPLSILVVTYNRAPILKSTLIALRDHVLYHGAIHVIVADDGSTDGTQTMVKTCFPEAELIQSNRVGLGASTNAGLRAAFVHSPYVLQLQDDMELLATLDLHPHIRRLVDDEQCGFIRLWGVSGHNGYTGTLNEGYWRIWWDSPMHYIPSDRPHIKHQRFHDFFGYYPEGLKTADTEEAWCHQCKDVWTEAKVLGTVAEAPHVYVPHSVETEKSWEHMGYHQRWRDEGL